jgi:hypothetical protein
MKSKLLAAAMLRLLGLLATPLNPAFAQGAAFKYQSQLNSGGNAANGSYGLVFALYSSGTAGTVIGGPVTNTATTVTN